jgi:hypothetical protein
LAGAWETGELIQPRSGKFNLQSIKKADTMTKFRSFSTVLSFMFLFLGVALAQAQTIDRAKLDQEIDELWRQIKLKRDLLLEPAPADKEGYAEFLKHSDTGLIRLLPRKTFPKPMAIRSERY